MTKKNQRQYHSRRQYAPSRMPWIIVGILCGFFIAALMYLYQKGTFTSTNFNYNLVRSDTKKSHEPQFDFYNILPDMKLADKEDDEEEPPIKQVTPKPIPTKEANKPQNIYFIQVASFPQNKDADHLKAELILNGYNVQVKKFDKQNKTWFRVMIGPYSNLVDAKNTQTKLKNEKRDTFLVTLSPDNPITG